MTLQVLSSTYYTPQERYPASPAERAEHMLDEMAMVISRRLSVYTEARFSCLADEAGLSSLDLRALAFIIEFGSLSTGHLGQLMGLSHGGVTALINRLESAGYVRRDRSTHDRRIVSLRPVPERCDQLMAPEQYVVDRIAEIARDSNVADLDGMFDFLSRCVKVLRQDTLQWLATRELTK